MYIFIIGGKVVVSPNSPVPPSSDLAPALDPTELLTKGNQLRLFNVSYPHLPYFHSPLCSGMLFLCLNYKRNMIPIVQVNRMWVIWDNVWKQWTELDKFLTSVLLKLVAKIRLLHLEVMFEPLPHNIPYAEEHFLEKDARGCAYKALRCFQHLFMWCSWAMSYFPPLDQPETGWSRLLLDVGFSPTMVQLLRDSPIGMFSLSPPRLGVVVLISHPDAMIMVPCMVGAHVPVWVWWGECDQQAQWSFSCLDDCILGAQYINDHCYPGDRDLAEAVRKALQKTVQPSSLVPATPPPLSSLSCIREAVSSQVKPGNSSWRIRKSVMCGLWNMRAWWTQLNGRLAQPLNVFQAGTERLGSTYGQYRWQMNRFSGCVSPSTATMGSQ